MNLLLFDLNERLIAEADAVTTCEHTEDANGNTATIVGYGIPKAAEYCAFMDNDGDLQLFRIKTRVEDKIAHTIQLYAENSYYELLTERPIIDIRPTAVTAGVAVGLALSGSRWELGAVSAGNLTTSTRWYYQQRISALADIANLWRVKFKFRVTVSGARIAGRFVDVLSNEPVWRGKRFEIGKDILEAKYTIDKRNLVTAIIGRGKGEETGDGYGQRIDFASVVWATESGDPVDKPAGQDYVEIPSATALYGVLGTRPLFTTKVYSDIEDAQALLQAAYDDLLTASEPVVSATLTVFDLEGMGFPHEACRYGDEVALIADDVRYRTQVVSIKRDYADRGRDVIQLGAPKSSLYAQVAGIARSLADTDMKAAAGAAVVQANASLLKGYLDTMVTRIISSGTNMYTDTIDGSLMFVNATGTKAMKLSGDGLLIASSKTGEAWNWSLALDGSGGVAQMLTSGVLQANLIKILGSEQFYWDAGNIIIKNPTNAAQQIRIGCYDGTHLGIAFTLDGGSTWKQAMTFTGITATNLQAATGTFTGELQAATGTFAGALQAATGTFAGKLLAGGWTFDNTGATYREGGTAQFQILFDSAQGASVASDLAKRLFLMGREMYFWNAATSGAVILGKDADAGYTQQCFFPVTTRTGNLGTPSHIWDTASIRAVFRESEGGLSSRRIKKRIRKLKSASTIIDALAPVTFVYRDDPKGKEHYGLIYEDTEKVAPLLCVQLKDDDPNPRNFGIDYSSMTVLLLKELQELRARVKTLEACITGK